MSGDDGDRTMHDLELGAAAELSAAGFAGAEEVGSGGFGKVYRCVEESLDRVVAVKVLTAEVGADNRNRFLREQHALAKFSDHPHIVQVYQAETTPAGRPFIVMPFHSRGSLDARIRANGPLPWQELLSIGVKLAGALETAHAHGVIHRDVNPANVLITDYGEPQLADFGIARMSGAFETGRGLIAGTPAYTAPEVLRGGPPDVLSDVYGLGATLFTALTGHAAFERKANESMLAQFVRISSEPLTDLNLSGVPALLCNAIESAMSHDRSNRPESARVFGERLRNIQFSSGVPVDAMVLPAQVHSVRAEDSDAHPATVRGPARPAVSAAPTTRYRPPTSLRRLVDRPRLLGALRDGQPRRLVFVHAPPGFGKSTLAAQWGEALEAEGIPVAWLAIVSDDNNVVWLLTHLIEAVRRVRPALAGELAQILEERSTDAAQQVMTTLINEIHARGEVVAVVVDDWHRITSPAAIGAMEFLLDNACHHLRLVVTSRAETGLPLGRMRVRDELVEIGENELRFESGEAERFLIELKGLHLAPEDVDRLCSSTEGWVAALQLAALSMRGKNNPAAQIKQISGRHFAIGEYLMETVVEVLEPDVLDFVMRTAITDAICGELAEVLTGVKAGQQMLEQVCRRELFLRRVDDDEGWFQYHGLFADFLRRRLADQDTELLQHLHLTASEWFAEHHMLIEAVDHALAANAPERATRLVREHADALIEDSQVATFLGLVAKLPASTAIADARLQLAVAWANVSLQRIDAAHTALERARAALAEFPADDEARADLVIEADVVRIAESLVQDRVRDMPAAALERMQRPVRPFFANAAGTMAAVVSLFRFDFDGVHRWHAWAAPYRTRVSGPFGVVYGDCVAGTAASEQLDLANAERLYRTAISLALDAGIRSSPTRLAAALLAELLFQRGQYTEAEELLAADGGIEVGGVDYMLAAYSTGARLAALRGSIDTAKEVLAEGQKVADNLSLSRLSARILNERIRLGIPIGEAERHFLEQSLSTYRRQPNLILATATDLAHDSAIRLLLAQGNRDASRQAGKRAERMLREIGKQNRPRALLEAQLRYGCCLFAAGEFERSVALLSPALSRCAELGVARLALDSAPTMPFAVEAMFDAPESPHLPPRYFLRQLLAEIDSERRHQRAAAQ
ncbi:protein kinase [Nocardia aobensis]|uniref:Serine/threonine-protein kinase PknK n=1 Tax=Nocardia aobensis TaxID=257277 RepID=A0ABW6PA00_9NOCA